MCLQGHHPEDAGGSGKDCVHSFHKGKGAQGQADVDRAAAQGPDASAGEPVRGEMFSST